MDSVTAKRQELERLYILFSVEWSCEPTEKGRQQFYEYESFGKIPEEPDPFFTCLSQGKKWFSVQQESLRKEYLSRHWCGLYCYWLDWKGERWVLKHLLNWMKNVPDWVFEESSE